MVSSFVDPKTGKPRPFTRRQLNTARKVLADREREKGQKSFREYYRMAWRYVVPDTEFYGNWHLDALCEHLQGVTEGHIQNLIINIPPRSGKSLGVGVLWPTWEWIRHPSMRYLFSSYSGANVVRDNVWARQLIQGNWYQERWGDRYQLSKDVNRKGRIENTAGGFRVIHGIGGGVTGEGGQRLVVDDPHELDDDYHPNRLQHVAEWWDGVMSTRVNNPATASRVIVQQRIHDKDLTGHLLEAMKDGGRHYETLILPTEYDPQRHQHFIKKSHKTGEDWCPKAQVDNLPEVSKKRHLDVGHGLDDLVDLPGDPRSKSLDLLWPQRVNREEVDALKKELKRKASGQLNQNPVPDEGELFKARMFHYYEQVNEGSNAILHMEYEDRVIEMDGYIFSTVDLAASLRDSADETVISTWMWTHSNHLLWLWCEHGRMEGPDIIPATEEQRQKYGAQLVGIEKNGMQLSFVQEARRKGMPAVGLTPDRDKRTRAITAVVMMDNVQLLLPKKAPWLDYAEEQLLKFTGSPSDDDDVVDTVSYAVWIVLNMLQKKQKTRAWGGGNARSDQKQRVPAARPANYKQGVPVTKSVV